jgi:16S rRNA (adenine1518-N6/adenine1519-N6)-dimethyltransferase
VTKNRHTRPIEPPRQRNEPPHEQSSWWTLLNTLGVRPSKAMGQNFLHENGVVRHIAQVAELQPDDLVIEVGPGLGVLTRELSDQAGRVIAVELDRRLAEYLQGLNLPNTEIVEADILQVDLKALTDGKPYIVVANLPYSVAAATIAYLLESTTRPSRIIVMVQREVAERIVANPPHMSLLAVGVQLFGNPRIMFTIGPGAFVPAPKVDSAVIKIDVFDEIPIGDQERKAFFRLVKAGFKQKRKQLANAISAALALDKNDAEAALNAAGIDPTRRAQTLSMDDWIRLHRTLSNQTTDG